MGLDMGLLAKLAPMDMFARPISITPAGGAAYPSRGIWHEDENDFFAEDGSIVTDHKVSIDVLDSEHVVLPRQGDQIDIPADGTVPSPKGNPFTIMSSHGDGGGMTNLVLQRYTTTVPAPSDGENRPASPQRSQLVDDLAWRPPGRRAYE